MSIIAIIVAILVFGAIVLVHEFGHFTAARKCGIKVEEFAIGMGPKLLSYQPGETVYSIRLFPIGGSCRMLGEDASTDEYETYNSSEASRAFNNKPVWQRIIVILAGAFMNFVLALAVALIITLAGNFFVLPVVDSVVPGSAAEELGLIHGDRIIEANGTKINIVEDLSFVLDDTKGVPISITILRNGEKIQKMVTPRQQTDEEGNISYVIGFIRQIKTSPFVPAREGAQTASIMECFENAFYTNIFYVKTTFIGLTRLVTFKIGMDQMSGPIGVVTAIGGTYDRAIQVNVKAAVLTMLNFMAFLSVNIGVFNLLPLPALDGGRFMFLAVEGIRRKPVKPETEGMVHFVGFALLMILAVFIAYNDIIKLVH